MVLEQIDSIIDVSAENLVDLYEFAAEHDKAEIWKD